MPYITQTEQKEVNLYYEDFGTGQPIILIHGWPLSSKSWEKQIPLLLDLGYRVISYDRKGFGKSTPTLDGYDYDSLASDLHEIISQLDLKNVILFGFSMGGGEVVRYITNYGTENIDKIALISSIIPLVKQKDDNPQGVPQDELDKIMESLKNERIEFLETFHKNFYNSNLLSKKVSQQQLNFDWSISSHASHIATRKCAESWANSDFRSELGNINVKTLIVHGDDDQIVPIETSAKQASEGISDNQFLVIKGGSHGLNVTHTNELNEIITQFLTTS